MDDPTRFVRLDVGQVRGKHSNEPTVGMIAVCWTERPRFDALFFQHYGAIREACTRFASLGVALVVIDMRLQRVAGSVWLAAKPGVAASAIVGRHDRADLFLDVDPSLSLRHIALLLYPLSSWDKDAVRYRLIDLRTQLPFIDETGQRLDALEASGPTFVCSGRYALACFVTGDATDWPEDPARAWALVPERFYSSETAARQDRSAWRAQPALGPAGKAVSRITQMSMPIDALDHPLCADDEVPLGTLTLEGNGASRTLMLGERTLRTGVLLGCYDRCDGLGASARGGQVSRVHLLVVRLEGRIWAIDTASTNGTYVEAANMPLKRFRQMELVGPVRLSLANSMRVTWTPQDA